MKVICRQLCKRIPFLKARISLKWHHPKIFKPLIQNMATLTNSNKSWKLNMVVEASANAEVILSHLWMERSKVAEAKITILVSISSNSKRTEW